MPLISAILRLGHKYELQGLYDQAMDYLTTYYTISFDAWADGLNTAQWQPDPVDAITAINLARLTNTTSILPSAFYICANLEHAVLRKAHLGDGPTGRLTEDDYSLVLEIKACLILENVQTARLFLFHLPPGAQVCSNRWGHRRCVAVWSKAYGVEWLRDRTVPHPVGCARALGSWAANVDSLPLSVAAQAARPSRSGFLQIFQFVDEDWWWRRWWRSDDNTLCRGCRDYLEARDREVRRKTWRKLPEFVRLTIEDWDKA